MDPVDVDLYFTADTGKGRPVGQVSPITQPAPVQTPQSTKPDTSSQGPAEFATSSTHTRRRDSGTECQTESTAKVHVRVPPPAPAKPEPPAGDSAESAKAQREADRLARIAESREAKQQLAKRNRSTIKPAVPRMTPTRSDSDTQLETQPRAKVEAPAFQPHTPARLRLDPSGAEEGSDEEHSSRPGLFARAVAPFRNFYRCCPNCGSDEIYPVNSSGRFIKVQAERGLLFQKFSCERCICAFTRPGILLGAPKPGFRPDDTELYS